MESYRVKAKKIITGLMIMCCFAFLLLFNVQKVEAEETQKADLYKNGTYQGNYTTMDAAFDAMTDSSAEYTVSMSGDQTVNRTDWPAVKSITIDGGSGGNYLLQLPEGETKLNCDVTIKNNLCFLPNFVNDNKYHCANVNMQNHTFTVDGEIGGPTIGYIWGYSDTHGWYVNFTGDESSNLVIKRQCQMLGTLNVNTVSIYNNFIWWSPYQRESNITNVVEYTAINVQQSFEIRTYGEKSRLNIQNVDAVGLDELQPIFSIGTGCDVQGPDCLVTIQNFNAPQLYLNIPSNPPDQAFKKTDIRIMSGLRDKRMQMHVHNYGAVSDDNVDNAKISIEKGTHLLYAPDLELKDDNVEFIYSKDFWDAEDMNGVSGFESAPETYMDNGYLCAGEFPSVVFDQYKILLAPNESTVVNVVSKSDNIASIEWSTQGNMSVSGDLSKATIQSTGDITGDEYVNYRLIDKNGGGTSGGYFKILNRDKYEDISKTITGVYIPENDVKTIRAGAVINTTRNDLTYECTVIDYDYARYGTSFFPTVKTTSDRNDNWIEYTPLHPGMYGFCWRAYRDGKIVSEAGATRYFAGNTVSNVGIYVPDRNVNTLQFGMVYDAPDKQNVRITWFLYRPDDGVYEAILSDGLVKDKGEWQSWTKKKGRYWIMCRVTAANNPDSSLCWGVEVRDGVVIDPE